MHVDSTPSIISTGIEKVRNLTMICDHSLEALIIDLSPPLI